MLQRQGGVRLRLPLALCGLRYVYNIRNEKMRRSQKDTITVLSALSMLVFGCSLTIAAFILPPSGEIHDSVLWVLGQSLIYAGGALGIANYAKSSAREAIEEFENERKRNKE